MVRLDRIITRGGDGGETSLGDGSRISKAAPRIEALGAVDELNALLGLCHLCAEGEMAADIRCVQNDLFDLGAELCVPDAADEDGASAAAPSRLKLMAGRVEWLEARAQAYNENLPALKSFILPGGSELAARLHVARTVARRAERAVAALLAQEPVSGIILIYLNRLADFLFILARCANGIGLQDPLWVPGGGNS